MIGAIAFAGHVHPHPGGCGSTGKGTSLDKYK
jgi:hypothetical protein